MNLRVLAVLAGVLGGACWVARWVAGREGEVASWADSAYWAGLALLGLALAGVGAGLVSRSAVWLRVLVAIAFPLLVWSVYSVLRGADDDLRLDAILGGVAVVVFAGMLLRGRRARQAKPRRSHGSHSAR